ncbi:hypothetical protein AFK68_11090 [Hydrocoleum sp. CS-953]|nr:hypothetical protein AFK68_11090 [Hydrocoleum sp. CS-953]
MPMFNNKLVMRTYAPNTSQNAWVILEGDNAWKVILGNGFGINNIVSILTSAQANGRRVTAFVNDDNQVVWVQMIT